MPPKGWSWKWITADDRVTQGPCLFHGVVVLAQGASAGLWTVYDGADAGGRQFALFEGMGTRSTPILFEEGVRFERGIFVDFGTNATGCLVLWEPVDPD